MSIIGYLYIIATPIGNLEDLTIRAAKTLAAVDFVAAEDTRVTAKLLNHLDIKKPMISYHRHNMSDSGARILDRIMLGESCALCSDAGTPAISDPGEILVRDAIARGIRVIPIPGACAAITALSASGLESGRFCFEGFLPVSKKNRREHLLSIANEIRTMVFYEAPHKLRNTLRDLLEMLGDRELMIGRELTKLHEEFDRTTLAAALEKYREQEPRGEFVLVVAGSSRPPEQKPVDEADVLERISRLRAQGFSLSEACRQTAAETGWRKSELYRRAISMEQQPE